MKGQRIPHEQSAETPSDTGRAVSQIVISTLQESTFTPCGRCGRAGRTGCGNKSGIAGYTARLLQIFIQIGEGRAFIYSTLSPTDATAAHMPEISEPKNRKDVLK